MQRARHKPVRFALGARCHCEGLEALKQSRVHAGIASQRALAMIAPKLTRTRDTQRACCTVGVLKERSALHLSRIAYHFS